MKRDPTLAPRSAARTLDSILRAGFAAPARYAFFDFVNPQYTGRHDVGCLERLTQLAFCLAVIFVVDCAEVEAQQRNAEYAGRCFRGETLATALDTEQENAFRRVEMLCAAVPLERRSPLREPFLEPCQATDVVEACCVVFELQRTPLVQ